MKYIIVLLLAVVGFGCASKKKSYCDIVDQETQASQPLVKTKKKK